MAPVQIILQVGKVEFQWQDGFEKFDHQEEKNIRKLLVLSKAVVSSLDWELSAHHKEKKALLACSELIGEGAQKINQSGMADFTILQGSQKEKDFISILRSIQNLINFPDATRKEWSDANYINSLWLISEFMGLPYVFLVVHTISKKRFRQLGAKGAPKFVQYIYKNKDKLDCPILAQQVDEIIKAAGISWQRSERTDIESRTTTASPGSSCIVNHIQLNDTSTEEDLPDREIVERSRTPDLVIYNALRGEQHDDHTECIKHHSPPTTTQPPLVSEYEMIDGSIIENFPSQTRYTLAVGTDGSGNETSGSSEAQFATTKRKRAPTVSQTNGFKKTEFYQSDLSTTPSLVPQSIAHHIIMPELSPASLQLLCIFAALGGDKVPRWLFEGFLNPQLRWGEDGYPVRVPYDYDSLGPLRELFKTEALTASLEELHLCSWIYLDDCVNHSQTTYSLSEKAREYSAHLSSSNRLEYWTQLALQVSCHVFPRDPTLEENFQKYETHLVHIIDHLLQQSKAYDLAHSMKLALSEVLIAKARLRRVQCPQQALDDATGLLGDAAPDHIHASIALRRSVVARLEGSYQKSEEVIFEYQKRSLPYETATPRLRALTRLVMISHIENLIQLEDYETASNQIENLNPWEPNHDTVWSPMELSVNFKKWSTISKIYQSQGRLTDARDYLSNCYPFLQSEDFRADPNRFQVICRLSDLLCADGYFKDARSKVEHEMSLIRLRGNLPKAMKRLEVSLLDVNIAEGKYEEASTLVSSLRKQFSTISFPDISDQWLHIRSVIASASLSHCQCQFLEAVSEWENLLSLLKNYPHSFEPEGFYFGLGHMSISVAFLLASSSSTKSNPRVTPSSCDADAKKVFDIGCTVLAREDINFWIPILPTRYIPELLATIRSKRPTWTETIDFLRLQQKYSDFLDSSRRQTGLSSRI